MKSISSRMAALALTLSLGFAAGSANAVPTITSFGGSAASGYTAVFGNNAVGNTFSDWISFSVPADTANSGGSIVFSNLSGFAFNVIFNAFNLYEGVVGVLNPPTLFNAPIAAGLTGGPVSAFSYSGAAVPGNYWLNVAGFKINNTKSGGYAGTITTNPVAAIPEPETYAMMLAGLGLLGFSARRRNKNV